MARARMIKPEFWDDEKLATIPREARLTFIGMWNYSDDYGVVKGHSAWLKNKIFPYNGIKQSDFEHWLSELERIGVILPFEDNREKYYFIRNFKKHQTINRPSQTRNPEPPKALVDASLSAHGTIADGSLSTHGGLTDEREVKSKKKKEKTLHEQCVSLFEEFYKRYPRHEGRQNAFKAWQKLNPDSQLIETILQAIENQKAHKARLKENAEFCPDWPMPATWLNSRRWEDEVPCAHEQDREDPIERAMRRMDT